MKRHLPYLVSLGLLWLSACGQTNQSDLSEKSLSNARGKVHAALAAKPDGENVVWSAASLDAMLTLVGRGYNESNRKLLETYLGRSIDKTTQEVGVLNVEKEGLTVKAANNIWAQESFKLKKGYLEDIATNYNGLVPGKLDVSKPKEAAAEVNKWADENTNHLIKEVVTPDMITPDLATLLANALYFKGEWKEKFKADQTKDLEFNTVNKASGAVKVKKVPTMQKTDTDLAVVAIKEAKKNYTAVRLPYKGDTHAMYLVFASKSDVNSRTRVDTATKVEDVYEKFVVNGEAFTKDFQFARSVDLFTLPKFTIDSKIEGIEADLANGGFEKLFAAGTLTSMSDDPRAALSFILQKAKIIVNEEGSEAAAVTVGGVRTTSIQLPVHVLVDGPFAYAIRDEAKKTTLFEGIVRSPAVK